MERKVRLAMIGCGLRGMALCTHTFRTWTSAPFPISYRTGWRSSSIVYNIMFYENSFINIYETLFH